MRNKMGQTLIKMKNISSHIMYKIRHQFIKGKNESINLQYTDSTSLDSKSTQVMEQYKFVPESSVYIEEEVQDKLEQQKIMSELRIELAEALEHWKWTQEAYNYAVGFEQVEYCIYQMMAAEQKYRMILLKARALQGEWSKVKGDLV